MKHAIIVQRIMAGENFFKCASAPEYVIRIDTSNKDWEYWIKFEKSKEFKTTFRNNLVTEAFLQIEFISEKQYNDFK